MMDLFTTLDRIYTSQNRRFIEEIDTSVSPVVLNLLLARYYRNAHVMRYLNKYAFCLDAKEYALVAWSMIPKMERAPFVKKIEKVEEKTRYDFILDKIRKRLDIGENDWKHCKDMYLEDVKKNLVEYLVFYGCKKKEWNIVGCDFDESRKIHTTTIIEGLGKWGL
jgi:hypothetical protein